MDSQYVVFKSSDNKEIVGRYFTPYSTAVAGIVIASAMGVKQDYYAPIAIWLANKGFLVVTFDYRGTGLSLKKNLRGFRADLFDWADDCATILTDLSRRISNKSIYWIGHSLGGQIVPFIDNIKIVTKIITVASGSGYWLENSWPLKRRVWWLWYVIVPITLPLFGYFPGKRLRKVGNLPKGVMAQWRRWCLNPDYCVGAEGSRAKALFSAIEKPIVSFSFEDDEMMSEKNINSLHDFFINAPIKKNRIKPEDIGVDRIGHFGFFNKKFQELLWNQYLLTELKQPV